MPTRLQRCPYSPEPKQFGSKAQAPLPPDESPNLDAKGINHIQRIVGSILDYSRAVDMTVLAALGTIAIKQTKATQKTRDRCTQLLDYLASNQDAKSEIPCVRYGNEHSFGRILPVRIGGTKSSMWTFLHGMDA